MTTPITTATWPDDTDPAMLLLQRDPAGHITYAAIHCTPTAAIRMLRRALIHMVAEHHKLTTVPADAVILPAANKHSPEPLTLAEKETPPHKKPGPNPRTPRLRKEEAEDIAAQARRNTWT